MAIKAFIFDFDNTIFPVPSIGHQLFAPLFKLIEEDGNHADALDDIREEVMRIPFQAVAEKHKFGDELKDQAKQLLQNLTYEGQISPYDDYAETKQLPGERFLVTTGFKKMQQSKIDSSGVKNDFKKVYIVDPDTTSKTKKDIFWEIQNEHSYSAAEVMIIGDDPNSEIHAANELGMVSVLYDKEHRHHGSSAKHTIEHYNQLKPLVDRYK